METNGFNWSAWAGWLILAEFAALAVLGFLLQTVMLWENQYRENRSTWIRELRSAGRQLRMMRFASTRAAESSFDLPLPTPMRRLVSVLGWIGKAITLRNAGQS